MDEDRQTLESISVISDSLSVIADQPVEESIVEELVLQLVNSLEMKPTELRQELTTGKQVEVILDINIEGVNYTLARRSLEPPSTQKRLSPRENEIARLIAKGYPNKTIAEVLDISPYTVATHIRRMFNKLDVKSRAEMIASIMKHNPGLIRNLK